MEREEDREREGRKERWRMGINLKELAHVIWGLTNPNSAGQASELEILTGVNVSS